jgi:hypothetical protein
MSNKRFEQLIEYVINDETAKAKELFHQIVVEKSRAIYEDLMEKEEVDEDNAMGEEPTEIDTDMSEDIGGSQAQDMIDDVETEEAGMAEDDESDAEFDDGAEEVGHDVTHDIEDEHDDEGDIENRVVDLEDKLDELMAEFEAMMGGDDGMGSEMGDMTDTPDMTDIEVQDDEFETESQMMPMEEAVSLKAAPKPVTSEEGGINKKSTVAANSGAAGMASKPVHMTGDTAHGRPAPSTKELIGKVGNTPAQSTQDPKPATKPHTGQAAGVNNTSPLPRGRKG